MVEAVNRYNGFVSAGVSGLSAKRWVADTDSAIREIAMKNKMPL